MRRENDIDIIGIVKKYKVHLKEIIREQMEGKPDVE